MFFPWEDNYAHYSAPQESSAESDVDPYPVVLAGWPDWRDSSWISYWPSLVVADDFRVDHLSGITTLPAQL